MHDSAIFGLFSHLFLHNNVLQNYVQTISNLLKEEHRDKWEEAQLVRDKRVNVWGIYEHGRT